MRERAAGLDAAVQLILSVSGSILRSRRYGHFEKKDIVSVAALGGVLRFRMPGKYMTMRMSPASMIAPYLVRLTLSYRTRGGVRT